jgi:hypothetical protein
MTVRIFTYTTLLTVGLWGALPSRADTVDTTVDYVIDFTITGLPDGIRSIGPGTFSYDSMGLTDTTVGPPVTLTNYEVPATLSAPIFAPLINQDPYNPMAGATATPVTFTQSDPAADSITLGPTGLVTGLDVGSVLTSGTFAGSTLQLNTNGTWTLDIMDFPAYRDPSGTYTLMAIIPVPEPRNLGLLVVAALLLGMAFRKRFA